MSFNNDFPVPLATFKPLVRRTPDEIWLKTLELEHGDERHTEQGWADLLALYWGPPAAAPEPTAKGQPRAVKAGK